MPVRKSGSIDERTAQFFVRRYSRSGYDRTSDLVAVEEPLEIRISHLFKGIRRTESASVTLRTPGHDKELALGFLFSEGVIVGATDVLDVRALGTGDANELLIELADHVDVESWHLRRATLLSSACGLCGKRTIDSIPVPAPVSDDDGATIAASTIYSLAGLLRANQAGFGKTGGLHAAAFISLFEDRINVFEDIGRHNALDKLIGHSLLTHQLPLKRGLVVMSSRGSFELVQKCTSAGCSILATIGAPSSLAIEFSRDRGLTLIGFVRDDHFNVYAGEWRLQG